MNAQNLWASRWLIGSHANWIEELVGKNIRVLRWKDRQDIWDSVIVIESTMEL